ncbi:lysozyme [Ensifer sp. ENS11]|uniref:lysozyme n=1 Tax=Ensifer sp. ENS11 TaxID=2769291 RepID=UPI0035C75E22
MNMNRRINAAGLALVKQWEGLKTKAYRDVAGVWTIGYGHTSAAGAPAVTPGMVISEAQADDILRADLATFEERVLRLVKVPLSDNQFAVLVSFDFNTGRLGKSTLLNKLNGGDYDAVPGELMKWVNCRRQAREGVGQSPSCRSRALGQGRVRGLQHRYRRAEAARSGTKENISWLAGILSSLGFALTGSGPLQWVFAGIIVAAFAIGAFLFVRKRLDPA